MADITYTNVGFKQCVSWRWLRSNSDGL